MARLGQPKAPLGSDADTRDAEGGPSSGGFHPVSAVAGFVDEEYARLFDAEEADAATQDVIDMIVGYSYDLDEFLSISNANGETAHVWAMDNEEAAPLARIWLKRAKRDKRAAAVLRLAMQGDDYKRAVIVLAPRLWQTGAWYPARGGFRMAPWEARGERARE